VAVIQSKETKSDDKVIMEREARKQTEWLLLKLGSLKANQDTVITLSLLETTPDLTGGAYSYKLPNKYFPRYKIVGDTLPYAEYDPNTYTFQYSVVLSAPLGKDISYVSTPSFANYVEGVREITIAEP